MYSLLAYGAMARDTVRMGAYAQAIHEVVKPGSVVVDLGAATGIASLLAAECGARVVHAIEMNPAIHLLPELARKNGFADRIIVHPRRSFDVELPEKADVIIADLRNVFSLFDQNLAAIRDATARFLRPDGVLVPLRDELFVAGFESFEIARQLEDALVGFSRYGFTANAIRESIFNTVYPDKVFTSLPSNHLLTDSKRWGVIDYRNTDGNGFGGTVELEARNAGTLHGLAVWFDATLTAGASFSCAPGSLLVYARMIMPFIEPIVVKRGSKLTATIRVDERGELWAWEYDVEAASGKRERRRQSTFHGQPRSIDDFLRASPAHMPRGKASSQIVARVIDLMSGERSIHEILDRVCEVFPDQPAEDVRREARDVIARYGL